MKLRYTPAAIYDLEQIADYFTHSLMNPAAAQNILGSIARDCSRLKEIPIWAMNCAKRQGGKWMGTV